MSPEAAPSLDPEAETAAATGDASAQPASTQLTPPPRFVPDATPAQRRARQQPKHEDDWPRPDWATEADRYAVVYPDRAQLIRRLGGLPNPCSFGPPEKELVRALVSGTSATLCGLDGPRAGLA